MRTTLNIDNEIERELRERAAKARRPFTKVVNDHLRQSLVSEAAFQKPAPFVVRAKRLGLKPGIDPCRLQQVADDLEAEAFIEQHRKDINQ